jgi:TonB family protein
MIAGDYLAGGNRSSEVVRIRPTFGMFYELRCVEGGWDGVGVLDGTIYLGVFRDRSGATGRHTIDFSNLKQPHVSAAYTNRKGTDSQQIWSLIPAGETPLLTRIPNRPPPPVASDPDHPAFGEYIHVDELPEAITKVQPAWPEGADRSFTEATVVVQALVGRDGTVTDTRVVNSDSRIFNDAAVKAVRQWHFKPALAKGKTVAVWVAIPMKFRAK